MRENLRIICLPYAGGSATAFQPLRAYWPASWEMITVELPGRGRRLKEPLLTELEAIVDACWQRIAPLTDQPYLLLGHSLGATLAYLLTHRIREEGADPPLHLFLSGTDGPCVPARQPHRHRFSRVALKEELKKYGGMPKEILNSDELFDFFARIIRADLQAIETWKYRKRQGLTNSVTVITGDQEDISSHDIESWQREFLVPVEFVRLPGRHFYLFEDPEAFVALILRQLAHVHGLGNRKRLTAGR